MALYIDDTYIDDMSIDDKLITRRVSIDRGAREAFILAGGRGIRLRPYTTLIPKPLVPIGDHSVAEILLCQLADRGFTKATISLGHLGNLIRAYIGDGSQWGIEVDYVTEDRPLGTVGPVLQALDQLPEHFVMMNGDILTDIDYDDLLATHMESGASLTLATYEREHKVEFGVLGVHEGSIVEFIEKPTYTYFVSMGVYAVSREMLRGYSPGTSLGVDTLILDRLSKGDPPSSYAFDGFWLDIGRPDDFDRANAELDFLEPILMPERRAS